MAKTSIHVAHPSSSERKSKVRSRLVTRIRNSILSPTKRNKSTRKSDRSSKAFNNDVKKPLRNLEVENVDNLISNMDIKGSPITVKPKVISEENMKECEEKENINNLSSSLPQEPSDCVDDGEFELKRSPLSSYTPSNLSPKKNNGDDIDSDCSVYSPVMNLPPTSASKTEISNYFWDMCYGPNSSSKSTPGNTIFRKADGSWSAKREPPSKSCLSSRKKSKIIFASKSSSFDLLDSETTPPSEHTNPTSKTLAFTPKAIFNIPEPPTTSQKNVKFGFASAAEFDFKRPAQELTPLPKSFAEERYKLEEKVVEEEEEEMNEVTKLNNSLLSSWEEDFDSFLDKSDTDTDTDDDSHKKRRRRRRKDRRKSGGRKSSSGRRDSTIFSRGGGSLIAMDEESEINSPPCALQETSLDAASAHQNMSPLLVEENESPSFSPFQNNGENRRRSSALFESVNRSGALSSSPENENVEDQEPVFDENKEIFKNESQQTNDNELKPNQLDYVLKKYCPHEDEKGKKYVRILNNLLRDTEHEIDLEFHSLLQALLTSTELCPKQEASKQNEAVSEICALKLISNFIYEKMDCTAIQINQEDVQFSERNALFIFKNYNPHVLESLQEMISTSIDIASESCKVSVDEISRQDFLIHILPHLQSNEMKVNLNDLFADVAMMAQLEINEWENKNIWKVLCDEFNQLKEECELEKFSLSIAEAEAVYSPTKIDQLIRNEEKIIESLQQEIEIVQADFNELESIETAKHNLKSQMSQKMISSMLSYSLQDLTIDRIQISFPRPTDEVFSSIIPMQSFFWLRYSGYEYNETKWILKAIPLRDNKENLSFPQGAHRGLNRNFQELEKPSITFATIFFQYLFQRKDAMKVFQKYDTDIQASILAVDACISKIALTSLDIAKVSEYYQCNFAYENGSDIVEVILDLAKDDSTGMELRITMIFNIPNFFRNEGFYSIYPETVNAKFRESLRSKCHDSNELQINESLKKYLKTHKSKKDVFFMKKLCDAANQCVISND